jgi:hypothetical protein
MWYSLEKKKIYIIYVIKINQIWVQWNDFDNWTIEIRFLLLIFNFILSVMWEMLKQRSYIVIYVGVDSLTDQVYICTTCYTSTIGVHMAVCVVREWW